MAKKKAYLGLHTHEERVSAFRRAQAWYNRAMEEKGPALQFAAGYINAILDLANEESPGDHEFIINLSLMAYRLGEEAS